MDFALSWDAYTWRSTGAACLAAIALLFGPSLIGRFREKPENGWAFQLVGLVLCAIMFMCALLVPWRYSLSPDSVIVHAGLRGYAIPLKDIAEVKVDKGSDVFSGARRSRAVGGLFGYSGTYTSRKLHDFQVDSGRLAGDLVSIRKSDGHIVILGPDDPNGFVARLNDARATLPLKR